MPYTAPSLSALRVSCLRVLRDDGTTFVEAVVDDFINEALAELNRFLPVERQVDIASDDIGRVIPVDLDYVYGVEQLVVQTRDTIVSEHQNTIPPNDPSAIGWRNGWDFFAGSLDLGTLWGASLVAMVARYASDPEVTVSLRVSGYGSRAAVADDADVPELRDLQEEFALRKYVALLGYRGLEHDRALFQQWLTQANNTDVSETQLLNIRSQAESEWERLQKQLKRVRRPPMG